MNARKTHPVPGQAWEHTVTDESTGVSSTQQHVVTALKCCEEGSIVELDGGKVVTTVNDMVFGPWEPVERDDLLSSDDVYEFVVNTERLLSGPTWNETEETRKALTMAISIIRTQQAELHDARGSNTGS